MANTATVHVRIDGTLKERAETILAELGLTSADAVKLLYKQIELNGGLPFDVKLPAATLAERKLLKELEIGERSAAENGWLSIAQSKAALGL